MSSPYRTRLQLTPKTKVKTQTRQRLVMGGSVLAVALLFGIGVFMYGNFGASHEARASISSNMGFEGGTTDWTFHTGLWAISTNATYVRTGTKSCELKTTSAVDRIAYNANSTLTAPASGTNYITVSAWIKATATNARVKFELHDNSNNTDLTAATYSVPTTTGFTFASYTFSVTNGHVYYPKLLGSNTVSGNIWVYFDDVMMNNSTSATTDQTTPNAPTNFTVTASGSNVTMNFTQGTDAGGAGIDGVLIIRQSGIQAADQSASGQITYATSSSVGPTSVGSYSVVYNGVAVSTYTDAPGTGSFTYLVYMRDKAYNYTAGSAAARLWVFNSSSTSTSVTASSAIDALYIPSGNTLTFGSASVLTFRTGSAITVSGTLKQQGTLTNNGTLTIANGGTFDLNRNGSSSAGTGIPTATWSSGSLCKVSAITNTVPLGTGQTFHHFTWDCTGQTSSVYLSTSFNANGNVNFLNTGASVRTVWFDGTTHFKGDVHATTTATFNFDYGSQVYLDGSVLQNIDNTGAYLWFQNVIVDNAAGVKLLDEVLVDSITTIRNGNINLNGKGWNLEDMATIVRESGTMSAEPYPFGYYDLTYKSACTTGGELVATYTDAVYRLRIDLTGTVTLAKNAYVNNSLTFVSGKIVTSTFEVQMLTTSTTAVTGYGTSSYVVGNLRRNVAGTGAYVFPVGTSSNYELITVTFVAQTGISNLLGYFNTTSPGTPSGITVNGIVVSNMLNAGYWTLSPNSPMTGGTYTATGLMQGYTNTGLNSNTKYYMLKRANSSSAWASLGTQNLTNGQVSGSPIIFSTIGLSSFSDFGAGYGGGSTLPITLSSFTVNLINNEYADLNWVTSAELNNAYFEVERSADGENYETIGKLDGQGTSLVMTEYNFRDEAPLEGTSYYRLNPSTTLNSL